MDTVLSWFQSQAKNMKTENTGKTTETLSGKSIMEVLSQWQLDAPRMNALKTAFHVIYLYILSSPAKIASDISVQGPKLDSSIASKLEAFIHVANFMVSETMRFAQVSENSEKIRLKFAGFSNCNYEL